MQALPGFRVGGAIHVVANNQASDISPVEHDRTPKKALLPVPAAARFPVSLQTWPPGAHQRCTMPIDKALSCRSQHQLQTGRCR